MTAWLLDTNSISELRRPSPNEGVLAFMRSVALDSLFLSVVTVAEIRYGIESLASGSIKRTDLEEWLEYEVRPLFAGRILPITEDIMLRWRIVVERGRRSGHTYSQEDSMIAATALHHGLAVVTRDRRHFDKAGARVLNPWTTD